MKNISYICLIILTLLFSLPALAADPSPLPSAVTAAQTVASQTTVQAGDFATAVLQFVTTQGGIPWGLKIATIILLVIASMKVTALDNLFWDKLKTLQVYLAPVLGLVSGVLILAAQGNLSLAGVMAYLGAGAGAVLLHELLDGIKGIPGLGSGYVSVITAIEQALGGNPIGSVQDIAPQAQVAKPPGT